MKSTALAVAAFALGGCGPEEWSFDAQRLSSTEDAEAAAPLQSGPDGPPPGCQSDTDCAQSDKHCDTRGHCVQCVDNSHCTNSSFAICNPLKEICEQCFRSTDCPSGGPATVPVCDVGQCSFSCADGGGVCAGRYGLCNGVRGRCAECLVDRDCADAGGGSCNTTSGLCAEVQPSEGPPLDDGGGAADSNEGATEASSDASSRGDATDAGD